MTKTEFSLFFTYSFHQYISSIPFKQTFRLTIHFKMARNNFYIPYLRDCLHHFHFGNFKRGE